MQAAVHMGGSGAAPRQDWPINWCLPRMPSSSSSSLTINPALDVADFGKQLDNMGSRSQLEMRRMRSLMRLSAVAALKTEVGLPNFCGRSNPKNKSTDDWLSTIWRILWLIVRWRIAINTVASLLCGIIWLATFGGLVVRTFFDLFWNREVFKRKICEKSYLLNWTERGLSLVFWTFHISFLEYFLGDSFFHLVTENQTWYPSNAKLLLNNFELSSIALALPHLFDGDPDEDDVKRITHPIISISRQTLRGASKTNFR